MADEHDTPLTDEQDQEVRRLLASARHDEPMPHDVVDRLDRVLDDLADEPARRAPVVDLAARRRRVASLLVAAAAVVVVGVGVGQLVGTNSGDDMGDSSVAGGASDTEAESPESTLRQRDSDSSADEAAPSDQAGNAAGDRVLVKGRSFAVDPDDLSRDLRKVQQYAERSAVVDSLNRAKGDAALAELASCPTKGLGEGTYVSIRYGDQPAILVLRPPVGETQVADVYLCGSRDPVRSLTLRLPSP
jgi:hypothetical protein